MPSLDYINKNMMTSIADENLYEAILEGNENKIKSLLMGGMLVRNVHVRQALLQGNETILKLLLQIADEKEKKTYDAFDIAFSQPNWKKLLKILIEHGCEEDYERENGISLYLNAGNLIAVETLLFYGLNPLIEAFNQQSQILEWPFFKIPIDYAFSLSLPTCMYEKIVKYGALHVQYENRKVFFSHFTMGKARAYKVFAKSCVTEIIKMKNIVIKANTLNLFKFLKAQRSELQEYLEDSEIVNKVLDKLTVLSLPIYKVAVLRKCRKKDILRKLSETRLELKNNDKEIILNSDCAEKVYRFLKKNDLISLWLICTEV